MSSDIAVFTPPTTDEAFKILKGLEGQVGNIASSLYNIQAPYLNEALSKFREFPNTINQLFGDIENKITNRYSDLFNVVQKQMNDQWGKSALNLSSLGMYNTPATQLTQADIINSLFGKVAEEKTHVLNQLDTSKLDSLVNYYSSAPQILASFGEAFTKINPSYNQYQMQLNLAKAINDLTTIAYPKATIFQQIAQLLSTLLLATKIPGLNDIASLLNGILNNRDSLGGNSSLGGNDEEKTPSSENPPEKAPPENPPEKAPPENPPEKAPPENPPEEPSEELPEEPSEELPEDDFDWWDFYED